MSLQVAKRDTIDFEFTSTPLATNAELKGTDYDNIDGEYETRSNEVLEVVGVEMVEQSINTGTTPDSLHTWDSLRLWDGSEDYPHIRLRQHDMGAFAEGYHQQSVPFGKPVLSGNNDPGADAIHTATPKFGRGEEISPHITNDGTAIDDGFTIRLHVWRWRGSANEWEDFWTQRYNQTVFRQPISMSNPHAGEERTYQRPDPINLSTSAQDDPRDNFTLLTGGVNQAQPKVYRWCTWSENNNATRANQEYKFTTSNSRVDEKWKQLEFDFEDQRDAVWVDYLTVTEETTTNLDEGIFRVDERDNTGDPRAILKANENQLPTLWDPFDATVTRPHDNGQLPRSLEDLWGRPELIWNDGGGFRVLDSGSGATVPAGNLLLTAGGYRFDLTS